MNKNELIEILKKQHHQYQQKLKEKIEYYGCHVISVDEYDFSFPEPDDTYDEDENISDEEYDYSFPDDEPSFVPEPSAKGTHQRNMKELIERIALLRGGPLQGDYLKRPKKN